MAKGRERKRRSAAQLSNRGRRQEYKREGRRDEEGALEELGS